MKQTVVTRSLNSQFILPVYPIYWPCLSVKWTPPTFHTNWKSWRIKLTVSAFMPNTAGNTNSTALLLSCRFPFGSGTQNPAASLHNSSGTVMVVGVALSRHSPQTWQARADLSDESKASGASIVRMPPGKTFVKRNKVSWTGRELRLSQTTGCHSTC